MSKKDTTLNLRIDAQLKQRFMDKLKANHETATDVLTKAMEDYCNDDSNVSNDDINRYSNDSLKDFVTTDEENSDIVKVSDSLSDKLNELWDVINLQQRQIQKLEYRLGKKCDRDDVEGVSCQLPKPSEKSKNQPVISSLSGLGIKELADFYKCSTDTLNKLIRKETGGKKGEHFSYKGVTWEITATKPRKFCQINA